jgi:hypothetical protein
MPRKAIKYRNVKLRREAIFKACQELEAEGVKLTQRKIKERAGGSNELISEIMKEYRASKLKRMWEGIKDDERD